MLEHKMFEISIMYFWKVATQMDILVFNADPLPSKNIKTRELDLGNCSQYLMRTKVTALYMRELW